MKTYLIIIIVLYGITIHTILSANHVVYASKVDRKWNSNNNPWGSKISFLQLTSSTSSKEIPVLVATNVRVM